MTFAECVSACLANRELVANYDRLRGTNVAGKGTWFDLAVDRATGRADVELEGFVEFVKVFVWERLTTAPIFAPSTFCGECLADRSTCRHSDAATSANGYLAGLREPKS